MIVTAPAAAMSRADFLEMVAPLFGKPTKADLARNAEIAEALEAHQAAIQQTYSIPKLWDQITARDALKAEYAERVREIEGRHDARLTECIGDPLRGIAA